jgi:glycosyltransferase involved in cell wall biosynthesis
VTLTPLPSVVYLSPDKMGGIITVIADLLDNRGPRSLAAEVLLVHNHLSTDTRFAGRLNCDRQTTVEHSMPRENFRAVLRRMARAITPGPGIVVASDLIDLAMLSVHDVGRAVVLILHGDSDYYYGLAQKHDAVIHAYVAASRRMYTQLLELLPHRASTIFHLPYGIPLPPRVRRPTGGPLRLIFAGRLEHGAKGMLDLPAIDAGLRARGVARTWTIAGGGPDEARLREKWAGAPGVTFTGTLSRAATVDLLADHDVFVLPTRYEGFPLALMETLGAGTVPVVSDVLSGVPDLVENDVTGLRPPVGDVEAFAAAIEQLSKDRASLERMSANGRRLIETQYDIRDRAAAYEALFARYAELYKPLSPEATLQYGSRLDQPWIPNAIVRAVRSAVRAVR